MSPASIDPMGEPSPWAPQNIAATRARGSIAQGLGLALGLHAIAVPVCCAIAFIASGDAENMLAPFLFIGGFQVLYMVPAMVYLAKRGRVRTLRGMQVALGITFLLNAACFGLVSLSFRGSSFH